MSLLVVLLFVLPIVIGVAVVGVKVMEFALNRELMRSRKVAGWVTLTTLVTVALAGVGWVIYVMVLISGDPS